MEDKKATGSHTAAIKAQIDSNRLYSEDTPDNGGKLKAEQPILEEIPSTAELIRGYAKWTDNDGNFHKVPIDGTTAIREPAHEQHELTIEDRDRVDQTLALKTPRRKVENAPSAEDALLELQDKELLNDETHSTLKDGNAIEFAPILEGNVVGPDDDPKFGTNDGKTIPR